MGRTALFRRLRRIQAVASFATRQGLSTSDALVELAAREELRRQARALRPSRREVVKGLAATGLVGGTLLRPRRALAKQASASDARIAVIGAGMGGLACAYALYNKNVYADIYERSDRAGGRIWSMGGAFSGPVSFPGQVVERGGELIDTLHTTMRSYATEFGLTLEDYDKSPGETIFWSDGEYYDEADVVDEYRDFTDTLRADIKTLSPPTADSFTDADEALDLMSLAEYLDDRDPGALLRQVLQAAYVGEYGRELDEQSALNLLLFIHADNSSNFREFGVYSDERFHLVGGNEQIPAAIADTLSTQIRWGYTLKVEKSSAGAYVLTFKDSGGSTVQATYDFVVFATPFSALRSVELDDSLGLPDWKLDAIESFDYGTNSKMMVGFTGRPWASAGNNGAIYASGLAHLQGVWETNYSNASTTSAGVLTSYSGGDLGAGYNTSSVQSEVENFLDDYDEILPGASSSARRDSSGNVVVHLEKWSENPAILGSYTNNRPGYFTTICEREGVPVDQLYFVGEHADSFYDWQGFMEGAANSGIAAATEILALLRVP